MKNQKTVLKILKQVVGEERVTTYSSRDDSTDKFMFNSTLKPEHGVLIHFLTQYDERGRTYRGMYEMALEITQALVEAGFVVSSWASASQWGHGYGDAWRTTGSPQHITVKNA